MGVYIPNMEKPKGCWLCTFQIVDPEGGANGCVLDHSIQSADWNEDAVDDCPLIEIDQEDEKAVLFLLRMRKAMREGKNWREFLDGERRAE